MIALAEPQNSWVAKWNGIGLLGLKKTNHFFIMLMCICNYNEIAADCVPGLYAIKVVGKLPEDLQRACEDEGLICRSTNK